MWICCMEILLANTLPWQWWLYEEMQCMSSLGNSPTQTIWWFTILANSYLLLKKLINRFYHKFANFDGLEGRQLWFNLCHRQLAHKYDLLQASQGHHWCFGLCRGHHQRSSEASRPPRLDYHQSGVAFHLKILVITMLFSWHQVETLHHFLSIDKRSDQKAK